MGTFGKRAVWAAVASLLWQSPALALEMYCWPLEPGAKILSEPDLSAIHPDWMPPTRVGTATPLRALRREVVGGRSFLFGNLFTTRGGVSTPNVFAAEAEWTCAYEASEMPARPVARQIKKMIAANLERRLADPYSVRSAGISDATIFHGPSGGEVLSACIEFNAKNRLGGYTGISVEAYVYREDGTLFQPIEGWRIGRTDEACDGRSFSDFSELEELGQR